MITAVNLVYLAVYISVTLIQYAHPPVVRQFPYAYVWAFTALSYPLCLALLRKGTRFLKGLLTILLLPVIAQAVEVVIYLVRANEFHYGVTATLVILGLYLIGTLIYTAIWFPIGYFLVWFIFQRRARTSTAAP